MAEHRCGTPERDDAPSGARGYVLGPTGAWHRRNLTYGWEAYVSDVSVAAQEAAFADALSKWAAVYGVGLTFTKVALSTPPDIVISTQTGAMASASYPEGSEVWFNDVDYSWKVAPNVGAGDLDYTETAIHEMGHALGLDHSTVAEAVMWPYQTVGQNYPHTLHPDDIAGIQALYPATVSTGGYDAPVSYDAPVPYDGVLPAFVEGEYVVKVVGGPSAPGGSRPSPFQVIATLGNVNVKSIRRELNGLGQAVLEMHPLDPQATELRHDRLCIREVQIWRGATLYWWGVPVSADANAERVTITCKGLLWYFAHRYFGPDLIQRLLNPDFEEDTLAPWTAVGCTATIEASPVIHKRRHVRLTGNVEGGDAYLSQTLTITTGAVEHPSREGDEVGMEVALSGWAIVETTAASPYPWPGPAFGERGLFIERRTYPGNVLIERDWEPITVDTTKDEPVRLATKVIIPENTTETVEVRLYCPGGPIRWEKVRLSTPESVGTPRNGGSVGMMIQQIVLDAAQLHASKSNLNIGSEGTGGATVHRHYPYADNANILEALNEFANAGLSDFEVIWNTENDRRLRNYAPFPKGTFKSHLAVDDTIGPASVLASFRLTVDGEAMSTWPRVLGQGSGTDREVAHARVLSTGEQGQLVLESVTSAAQETTLDGLDALAFSEAARRLEPVLIPELTVRSEAHIAGLEMGDTIPVKIAHGWASVDATYRVVWTELRPATEELVIGLNAVSS